jgi:peptidoglycan/xylan/chitin deacetylase (PgdA/CDA1 family)
MIRNFLFHRVNPTREKLWDPMDVELFEKCIKYISNKYHVVRFEDLIYSEQLHSKNKMATIMFDDGYKDNIEYAFPILEKYNCKASFYIVTNSIENNIPTWTHILEYLFEHTNKTSINLQFDFIPSELQITTLKTEADRLSYASQLKPFIKKISHEQRTLILDRIAETFSDVQLPQLMMDWNDIQILHQHGHYIGSHTATHLMLGTTNNHQLVLEELTHSGKQIEEKLGYFPLTISYPVGSYTGETKQLAQKAGYQIGLAVKQQIYSPLKSDLFEVDRIELYNESWFKTRLRISNQLEALKKLIRYR